MEHPEERRAAGNAVAAADDKKKIKDLEHQVALLEFELEYRKKRRPWPRRRES